VIKSRVTVTIRVLAHLSKSKFKDFSRSFKDHKKDI